MPSSKCGVQSTAQESTESGSGPKTSLRASTPLSQIQKAPGLGGAWLHWAKPGPSCPTALCHRISSPAYTPSRSLSPDLCFTSTQAHTSDRHFLGICTSNPKLYLYLKTAKYTVKRVGQWKSGKIRTLPWAAGIKLAGKTFADTGTFQESTLCA